MAEWFEEMSMGNLSQLKYELDLVKVLGFSLAEARAIGVDKLREVYLHEMIEIGDAEAIAMHKKKKHT